jgi:cell pole-organizing protein PopZ
MSIALSLKRIKQQPDRVGDAQMSIQSKADAELISKLAHKPSFQTINGLTNGVAARATPPPVEVKPRIKADETRNTLRSSKTNAAVQSAFKVLAGSVLVENASTLEDLVREMLRPMLKSWLDDNLPSLVERLVRAEIERASRGRPD